MSPDLFCASENHPANVWRTACRLEVQLSIPVAAVTCDNCISCEALLAS